MQPVEPTHAAVDSLHVLRRAGKFRVFRGFSEISENIQPGKITSAKNRSYFSIKNRNRSGIDYRWSFSLRSRKYLYAWTLLTGFDVTSSSQ